MREGRNALFDFSLEVVVTEIGQTFYGHKGCPGGDVLGFLEGLVFWKSRPVAGAKLEISCQLSYFGKGADQRFLCIGCGASSEDDLTSFRKGAGIPG